MKIRLLKMALIAVVAGGALAESINAAQPIDGEFVPLNAQQAKRQGSMYKNLSLYYQYLVNSPELVEPRLARTDTVEMMYAFKNRSLDVFAHHYAVSAGVALEHYINTNLLAGGPGVVMLAASTGNLENAAADADVYDLVTDAGGHAAAGAAYTAGGGFGLAGFAENEMPADLTKGAFIAALKNRMDQVTAAHLHGLNAFAFPERLSALDINRTATDIKDAVKADIAQWIGALDTGGAAIFDAAVANAGGGLLVAANITGAGAGGPGMSVAAVARPAVHPIDLTAANIIAAFDDVIDYVDLY